MRSNSERAERMPTSPRFVYFDLDDTLLDHRAAERAALRDLAVEILDADEESTIVGDIQEAYHDRNVELWQEYSAGRILKDELRQRRFRDIADRFGAGRSWQELDSFYMNRYAEYWAPVDGALSTFEYVSRHIPVGIITNGFADTQHAKLDRFPLLRELSRSVVISEEVGFLKPDGRLFGHAEAAVQAPGDAILYVGDSLRSDVRGALAAGWQAAWYSRGVLPEDLTGRVFVFSRWGDLTSYLSV